MNDYTPESSDVDENEQCDAGLLELPFFEHSDDESDDEVDLPLPEWFLENCVLTAESLKNKKSCIDIVDDSMINQIQKDGLRSDSTSTYRMASTIYQPLRTILDADTSNTDRESTNTSPKKPSPHELIYLRFPDAVTDQGSKRFFNAVVENFAQGISADIVRVDSNDIEDLYDHFVGSKIPQRSNYDISYAIKYSEVDTTKESKLFKNAHLHKIFSAVAQKSGKSQSENKRPLIFHILGPLYLISRYESNLLITFRNFAAKFYPNAIIFLTPDPSMDADIVQIAQDRSICSGSCCAKLRQKAKQEALQNKREATILEMDTKIIVSTDKRPKGKLIRMAPIFSATQRRRFISDVELEKLDRVKTVAFRSMRRLLRQTSDSLHNVPILQPHADWSFLEGSSTAKLLEDDGLTSTDIDTIVADIGTSSEDEVVKKTILEFGRRKEILSEWVEKGCRSLDPSKWSYFSTSVQEAVKEIEASAEADKEKFENEKNFLDLVINPGDVEEGWSDIVLPPTIKEAVCDLLQQFSECQKKAYGILKSSRIGGALLYGPPGTGKTQLARVLAKESGVVTICVSAADLLIKWVGDTESAIQALFKVGRMLYPSIIFIDEADSLFKQRSGDDKSWERSKLNQLLGEMDGLKKEKKAPFVLIATNYPSELDQAVLRRVASRLHIGLPDASSRSRIFQIYLRDETIHADVCLDWLTEKSEGYSGSDITALCVQSALACTTTVPGDDSRRLLSRADFVKGFSRTAPTVSKVALANIKDFAKENDPASFETMTAPGRVLSATSTPTHDQEQPGEQWQKHKKEFCAHCKAKNVKQSSMFTVSRPSADKSNSSNPEIKKMLSLLSTNPNAQNRGSPLRNGNVLKNSVPNNSIADLDAKLRKMEDRPVVEAKD